MTARFIDPQFCHAENGGPPRRPFRAISSRFHVPDSHDELVVRVYDEDDMLLFISTCHPLDLEEEVEQVALDLCSVHFGGA